MSELPATREEALALGLTRYFTGQPCKNGHIAERYESSGHCAECVRESCWKWREDNPDKMREKKRQWNAKNADKERERKRKWRAANREKARESNRRYIKANREGVRERDRRYRESNPEKRRELSRKWGARNPEKRAAYAAARKSRKLNATPPWADMAAIEAIYAERKRVSAETGIEHHVDHIVPLRGKHVCGLHVPWNLQILTASENIKKGNRLPHDRRCCPA